MISLKRLMDALATIDIDTSQVSEAVSALKRLQNSLEDVEVKGRQKVDTLLGCMIAIDSIIGEGDEFNAR